MSLFSRLTTHSTARQQQSRAIYHNINYNNALLLNKVFSSFSFLTALSLALARSLTLSLILCRSISFSLLAGYGVNKHQIKLIPKMNNVYMTTIWYYYLLGSFHWLETVFFFFCSLLSTLLRGVCLVRWCCCWFELAVVCVCGVCVHCVRTVHSEVCWHILDDDMSLAHT